MPSTRTQQSARRVLQFEKTRGFLGKTEPDGDVVIRDAASGLYWVRPEKSTGNLGPAVKLPLIRNASLPARYNLAVELSYDQTKQLSILGVDTATLKQQGISPALLNPAEGKNIIQEQVTPLLCRRHPAKAYYAIVYPGIAIIGGTVVDFEGGEIDLASEQPTAGNHCYTGVYLDDSGALGVSSSTPQSTGSPLVTADLQEVVNGLPADVIPLRAFVLSGDSDDFSDSPTIAKDLRSPWGVVA